MNIVSTDLCYKGERDYLHGTDMYDAIVNRLVDAPQTAGRFRMKIARVVKNQLVICLPEADEKPARPEGAAVDFSLDFSGEAVVGWLSETERTLDCRRPYDEERIEILTHIQGDTIRTEQIDDFTPIEVVVAMTKLLHLRLFPSSEGRWMFTGLDLEHLLRPQDKTGLSITFEHALGSRLTKSKIEVGEGTLGYIFFSLVKP